MKKSKSDKESANEDNTVELTEMNIILRIPESAASVTVTALVIGDDDRTVKVSRKLSAEDIRAARQDFLDNVEDGDDYDALYVLTDKGREDLERLKRRGGCKKTVLRDAAAQPGLFEPGK